LLLSGDGSAQIVGCVLRGKDAVNRNATGASPSFYPLSLFSRLPDSCFAVW